MCGVGTTSGPPSEQNASSYGISVDVGWFGAKGDGSTDDTTAIQNAINSLPATGGIVNFEAGKTYCVSSTIVLGNGTTSSRSTINGTILNGANGAGMAQFWSGTPPTIAVCSGSGFPIVQIKGEHGWGINGLSINCEGVAGMIGLEVLDGNAGNSSNLNTISCATHVWLTSDAGGNSQINNFTNLYMSMFSGPSGSLGLRLSGDTVHATNSSFNIFHNAYCNSDNTVNNICFILQDTDSNLFDVINVAGIGNISGAAAISLDYSGHSPGGPASNVFMRPGFFNVNANHGWSNIGTPNQAPNYIYYPDITNGNMSPQLAGTEFPVDVEPPGIALTGQTATVTAQQLSPNGGSALSAGSGLYRACGEIMVTTTGVGGATLSLTFNWIDGDIGGAVTKTAFSGLTTSANNHNDACVFMYVNGGSTVTLTATVTGTMGAAQYALRGTFERMQ